MFSSYARNASGGDVEVVGESQPSESSSGISIEAKASEDTRLADSVFSIRHWPLFTETSNNTP